MVSLTYRTQDLVKIDNESFELEHILKCDRNIYHTNSQRVFWASSRVSLAWDNETHQSGVTERTTSEDWVDLDNLIHVDWWNFVKQAVTIGAQLLWSTPYGCIKWSHSLHHCHTVG